MCLRGITSPPRASAGHAAARPGSESTCTLRSQVPTATSAAAGAPSSSGAALRHATWQENSLFRAQCGAAMQTGHPATWMQGRAAAKMQALVLTSSHCGRRALC